MRYGTFLTGKVPIDALLKLVLRYVGARSHRVLLGPAIGEDAAVLDMGRSILVVSSDPITGAERNIGWLSVHINANDVACTGAKPLWYLCDILLPEKAKGMMLKEIMRQVDGAAKSLGVSVIGGHSEVTPGLRRPIVVGTMIGEAPKGRYMTSSGARLGDDIILTKGAGIEGTAILATDLWPVLRRKLKPLLLARAKALMNRISVVKDSLTALKVGGVHALHDPTEGGILMGLWELAEASSVGMRVYEDAIPILPETSAICAALNVNPLGLMGSGSLLIASAPAKSRLIIGSLRRIGIRASIIGRIEGRKAGRKLVHVDGTVTSIHPPPRDELYSVLERYGGALQDGGKG